MDEFNGFIPRLSRAELLHRVGLLQEIDPLITEAYEFQAKLDALADDWGHGRAHPWHVSFHGSSFPGDNPMACPRQAIYKLMNVPRYSVDRKVVHAGEVGKAMEEALVVRWWRAGYLLSPPPWESQWEFENQDSWLVATTDAIVLPPGSRRPRVVEVKFRYDREIHEMLRLYRGPDEYHARQVKCQIGMAHEAEPLTVQRCYNTGRLAIKLRVFNQHDEKEEEQEVCPQHEGTECLYEEQLETIDRGWIYYASRDDATRNREFFYEHDPAFMEAGFEKLKLWRQFFEQGVLPQTEFSDKKFSHPFGWRWTYDPCQYCDFGQECRADHKKAVANGGPIKLVDSEAIDMARSVRPDYDYEAVRNRVFKRWGLKPAKTAA